jgi:hypothetical protein
MPVSLILNLYKKYLSKVSLSIHPLETIIYLCFNHMANYCRIIQNSIQTFKPFGQYLNFNSSTIPELPP